MKKLFLTLTAGLLAASIANAQNAAEKKFTVVCLGDSITHAGYPAELEKLLPIRVINAGVNGNTSRQGLKRLERDVLSRKPDAVIIFFGVNDSRLDAPKIHVPLPEYETNLSTIIDRCRAIGAKVILGASPPVDSEAYYTRHPKTNYLAVGGLEPWLTKYRETVLRVVESKRVPLVDLNQRLTNEPAWRQPDGVHPTDEGNKILARIFAQKIKLLMAPSSAANPDAHIGLGAKPISGADLILDGSRKLLDEKWTYWEGPHYRSSLPIKWPIVDDPVEKGTAVMSDDPVAKGGKYGTADIVTKKAYRDFRLHIEFLVMKEGGNSGVYLQNRYEIQILDGDKTMHGIGAVINETESPYYAYNGVGKWNAYDINFRAARFKDGQLIEKAMVTIYFNGIKVHLNQTISQVWGGRFSGIDGGNDGGKGITDTPGGLKLQCEGHDVRYRNAWIKEIDLEKPETDF